MSKRQKKLPEEAARFLAANPGVATIDALFVDLSGVVRGKRFPIDQLGKLLGGGIALPGSVFLLDTAGASHDPCGYGFSDGDPDNPVVVAPGSLKRVPWTDPPGAQLLLRFLEKDGQPYRFEPRTVAQRVLERVHALGLRPVVAFELEFYLLDPERAPDGRPQAPISPLTGQRDTGTQVYGMNEIDAYAGLLDEVRGSLRGPGRADRRHVRRIYAPASSRSTCSTWTTRCWRPTTASCSSASSRAWRGVTACRPASWPSPTRGSRAAACTCTRACWTRAAGTSSTAARSRPATRSATPWAASWTTCPMPWVSTPPT